MAAPGRTRDESKNVQIIDEIDPRIKLDRQAETEVATVMAAYLRARYQFVAESALDKSN
jgi:hypothetical protein